MTNSQDFFGGATDDLSIEYEERRKYIQYFRDKGYPLLDTLYEKKLYGLINHKGQVVVPTPVTKTFDDPSSTVVGLTYVVDMFEEFRKRYYSTDSFKIPDILSDLKVTRSYEDFDKNFKKHELYLANKTINLFLQKFSNQPVSFEEFVSASEEIIFNPELEGVHFTRSGYSLSSDSSIYHTGLYVELLPNLSGQLDAPKVEIMEDKNFECYATLAYESGFYVDANSPWRLALNLDFPLVKKNILNGRDVEKFDLFYSDVYRVKTGYDDYWSLLSVISKIYIEYLSEIGLPLRQIRENPPTSSILRLLLANRLREIGIARSYSFLSSRYFENILQKTIDLYNIYGLSSNVGALGFINKSCGDHVLGLLKTNEYIANFGHRKKLQGDLPFPRV